MKEIEQGQKNLEVLLSEPYRVYEDNGIAVVLMTQGMDDIPGPVLHKQFGFSNDRFLLAKQQEADTDKYTYKYVMNGHGWAPTKQRPNLKKPYVERLISKLDKSTGGVKWAKAPGLTGLVESKGVVDMDHEDVVDIFATTDNTLRTLAVLKRELASTDDPTAKAADDIFSSDKLGRSKKQLRY